MTTTPSGTIKLSSFTPRPHASNLTARSTASSNAPFISSFTEISFYSKLTCCIQDSNQSYFTDQLNSYQIEKTLDHYEHKQHKIKINYSSNSFLRICSVCRISLQNDFFRLKESPRIALDFRQLCRRIKTLRFANISTSYFCGFQ